MFRSGRSWGLYVALILTTNVQYDWGVNMHQMCLLLLLLWEYTHMLLKLNAYFNSHLPCSMFFIPPNTLFIEISSQDHPFSLVARASH